MTLSPGATIICAVVWVIAAVLAALLAATWLWLLTREKTSSISLVQQQLTSLNEHLTRVMSDITTTTGGEIARLHQRVDERMKETSELVQATHRSVGERLDKNTEVFTKVHESLTRLQEANKQIQAVGEEIAKLQNILHAPKLRGNLGELFLEELLSQILPRKHFEMQYAFRSGEKVDAIIRLPHDQIVPIDAKFPLENFQKMIEPNVAENVREQFRKAFVSDFKKHVDRIAAKYILPDEGTLDFALLYVPAENIYYEAILRDDRFGEDQSINTYSLNKRVIPVSPNSLYAYLQAIVLGLRGLQIETRAKEIFAFLARLRGEMNLLREEFELVGKHVQHANSAFDRSEKRLERVQGRIADIEEPSSSLESAATEKPQLTSVKS